MLMASLIAENKSDLINLANSAKKEIGNDRLFLRIKKSKLVFTESRRECIVECENIILHI